MWSTLRSIHLQTHIHSSQIESARAVLRNIASALRLRGLPYRNWNSFELAWERSGMEGGFGKAMAHPVTVTRSRRTICPRGGGGEDRRKMRRLLGNNGLIKSTKPCGAGRCSALSFHSIFHESLVQQLRETLDLPRLLPEPASPERPLFLELELYIFVFVTKKKRNIQFFQNSPPLRWFVRGTFIRRMIAIIYYFSLIRKNE